MNAALKPLQAALGLAPDGIRGPLTTAAILKAADAGRLAVLPVAADDAPVAVAPKGPQPEDDLPETGRAKLQGVNAQLVSVILAASARCDVPFTCIEGLRSIDRQRQLVKAGASRTMRSRHITGHAVDLWPLDPATGKPLPSDAAFPRGSAEAKAASARLWSDLRAIAAAVKAVAAERNVAVEWGGDWSSFPDGPHFQLSWANFPA